MRASRATECESSPNMSKHCKLGGFPEKGFDSALAEVVSPENLSIRCLGVTIFGMILTFFWGVVILQFNDLHNFLKW